MLLAAEFNKHQQADDNLCSSSKGYSKHNNEVTEISVYTNLFTHSKLFQNLSAINVQLSFWVCKKNHVTNPIFLTKIVTFSRLGMRKLEFLEA
jgi:hypothetical protein